MPQITPKDPKLSSSVMEKKKKETATIITAAAAAAATTTKPTAVRAVSHRRRRPQAAEQPPPSLTIAVFVCWIVPVLLIAILTRFRVDDDGSSSSAFPAKHSKPVALNINMAQNSHMDDNNNNNKSSPPIPAASKTSQPSKYSSNKAPTEMPTILKNKPTGYQEVVKEIEKRRLDWTSTSSGTMGGYKAQQQQEQKPKSTTAPTTATKTQGPPPQKTQQSRGASSDPVRMQLADQINELRKDFKNQPNDIYRAANLADALRMYDVQYHDGGTYQNEAIETYQRAIGMAMEKRQTLIDQGEETSRSLTGTTNVNEETFLDYSARSVDGLLCALYVSSSFFWRVL